MLPVRRLPPVRLRPRRRRHHRRRRPWAVVLTTGFARRRRAVTPAAALLTGLAAVATALVGAPAAASGASVAAAGAPAAASVAAAGAPATAAGASADRKQPSAGSYIPPVDAPIADPFRPPAGPYGAGNRGLEYATEPGTPVRASAAGAVTFAGPVAGALHVTVLHADGVRTSYSFLAGVEVVLGQQVQQGDRLGVSGERLHFGARAGDAYFDPAALFAGTFAEVELLPFEEAPGNTPDAEARALAEMALADGGWRASLPGLGDTLTWLRDRARTGVIYVDQLNPLGRGLDVAGDLADRLLFRGPCSAGRAPVRPIAGQRRVAVTVAGLGSSSDAASIDDLRTDDLGYDRDRVVRFSYAGGRTPTTGAAFGGIDARPYAAADTLGDVAVVAGRLADVVGQVAAADPDAIVDVFAHSLGGLVTRLALVELRDRGFDLGRLGVVTTLGSPHRGADAATAVVAANTRPGANLALDAVERVLGTGLDPDAPVVGQLAEHSAVVARLRADGVPAGVRLVSIAARGDLVAAAPRTEIAGAVNITVPVMGPAAHGGLVGSDAATVEMARALAGQHPGCESWDDAVADVVTGHAVSAVEDHVGATGAMGW
jgi:murein DD-endopeptidase MepM/ murein hydrolase activator NlpD